MGASCRDVKLTDDLTRGSISPETESFNWSDVFWDS